MSSNTEVTEQTSAVEANNGAVSTGNNNETSANEGNNQTSIVEANNGAVSTGNNNKTSSAEDNIQSSTAEASNGAVSTESENNNESSSNKGNNQSSSVEANKEASFVENDSGSSSTEGAAAINVGASNTAAFDSDATSTAAVDSSVTSTAADAPGATAAVHSGATNTAAINSDVINAAANEAGGDTDTGAEGSASITGGDGALDISEVLPNASTLFGILRSTSQAAQNLAAAVTGSGSGAANTTSVEVTQATTNNASEGPVSIPSHDGTVDSPKTLADASMLLDELRATSYGFETPADGSNRSLRKALGIATTKNASFERQLQESIRLILQQEDLQMKRLKGLIRGNPGDRILDVEVEIPTLAKAEAMFVAACKGRGRTMSDAEIRARAQGFVNFMASHMDMPSDDDN
ncbi:hypothetical protein BJ508DRAFT_313467 [Ascobolus immersus RN42]|uniref:Uncharacterized protein n=1 Tax=Ascobolus immersus RN42 TaxID=1160509 RepID=A0A3N4HKF6_ASCIM|nr:hypothetical protein BJ508DRAFT_313467 [Ascobolus immersus RN42]